MIDLYQKGGTGAIKLASERDLDQLMRTATERGWSANGPQNGSHNTATNSDGRS
jgi:hypothetical protein